MKKKYTLVAKRNILNFAIAFVMGIVLAVAIAQGAVAKQNEQSSRYANALLPIPIQAQTQPSIEADHIMLRVPNFEETMQWYEEKLGFSEVLRWQEPSLPGVDLAYLELNNFRLEILGGGEPQPQKAIPDPADVPKHTQYQGYRHLCFRTPDVDATLAELNQKGVPTFAPAYDYAPIQRRLAFVLDNNGNAIEFSGPMKGQ